MPFAYAVSGQRSAVSAQRSALSAQRSAVRLRETLADMKDFRKLSLWQKARELTLMVYQATRSFPREELYGLTSQQRRGATSIPSNIAEGCGRGSDAGFGRFLQRALGSASEME